MQAENQRLVVWCCMTPLQRLPCSDLNYERRNTSTYTTMKGNNRSTTSELILTPALYFKDNTHNSLRSEKGVGGGSKIDLWNVI